MDKTRYTQALLQADAFRTHTNTKWCFEIAVKRRGSEVPTLVHSAEHIPLIWFTARPKTSIKNPGRYQTGARVTSEIADCTIMHSCSLVPRWDRLSSSLITQTHVDEHFPLFELLVALMSSHLCHEESLQTNNSWLLILHVRHEQFLQTNSGAN